MSANSKIEWCDHTFNPWIGCTKVSAGCTNCYAEARDRRFAAGKHWGKGAPRQRTSASNWKQPIKWNRDAGMCKCGEIEASKLHDCSAGRYDVSYHEKMQRARVFCASLADWLDDEVPIEWLADLLALIDATPNLDWLLLTKRPENFVDRLCAVFENGALSDNYGPPHGLVEGWLSEMQASRPPKNVWLGVSVEDQEWANERIPKLLEIPAVVRFLSCEPLLGPIDLTRIDPYILDGDESNPGYTHAFSGKCYHPLTCRLGPTTSEDGIRWVICGGESGAKARPMHQDWARSLRDQCAAASVPFFFKQWGEWEPLGPNGSVRSVKGVLTSRHFSRDNFSWLRVGKKRAGRLLDDREWNEMPEGVHGKS